MNTVRREIDYTAAGTALAQVAEAGHTQELHRAIKALAAAAHTPSFVLFQIDSHTLQVSNSIHNLGDDVPLDEVADGDVTRRILANPMPVVLRGELKRPELTSGVAVAGVYGSTCAVLMLGDREALTPDHLLALMGLGAMAAAQVADCLRRLQTASCPLTERELECLSLAATGATAKTIALCMDLSHRTVEQHLVRLRKKLEVESTLAATSLALRRGWFTHYDIERQAAAINRRSGAGRK